MTIVVPAGAEARAVQRMVPRAVVVRPGAASANVPAIDGPGAIVAVGLCGALRELSAGSVVVYRSVTDASRTFALDGALADMLLRALPGATAVTAFTADRVVTRRADRSALAQRYAVDVVDMEGTHLAATLSARSIPFGMVRVVSDDARRDLPSIGNAIGPDGRLDPLRVALAFARAPRAAFAFMRDVRRALGVLAETAAASAAAR